jgi:arylsulfatase A-like enzyme
MKMVIQKVFLILCILVSLSPFSIGTLKSEVRNSHNQANAKEKPPLITKTNHSDRPNVLLIGIETLRADHVSCLGYHRNTTPTFDKLAKEGVLFSKAIATSSWTMPTNMSAFTSLYPSVHKTTTYQERLPEGRNTLAQILKENGYLTAAFVSNATLGHQYGFSKGFDLYDDFSVALDLGVDLFGNNDRTGQNARTTLTNEVVSRAAIGWLQKNHTKQFFMFVFYFDPHYDYIPPPPFDTVFDPDYKGSINGRDIAYEPRKSTRPPQRDLDHIIALYDGEILYTDGYVSKLLEKFAEYRILDETLIIIFGDHGDEFYEHGSTAHSHSLYTELTHIPLIFNWPRAIPRNKRVSAIVGQVDIMPTVLDYLDIEYDGFMQGSSLRPLIEGQKNNLHDVVYSELTTAENKVLSAATTEDYKFILNLSTGSKQLFDLNNDPNEQINIYESRSSAGSVPLEYQLKQWFVNNEKITKQLFGNENLQKIELDEDQLRQLKSLGYLQ